MMASGARRSWLFGVVAWALASAIALFDRPPQVFDVAEVTAVVADARPLSADAKDATGAILATDGGLLPLYLGYRRPFADGPDVAPLRREADEPQLTLYADGALPAGASFVAAIEPIAAPVGARVKAWRLRTGNALPVLQVVRPVDAANGRWRLDDPLVAWLDPLTSGRDAPVTSLDLRIAAAMPGPATATQLPCGGPPALSVEVGRQARARRETLGPSSDGVLQLRSGELPSYCLERMSSTGKRRLSLDPRVPLTVEADARGGEGMTIFADFDDKSGAHWVRCQAGQPTALTEGDRVGAWQVVSCPGSEDAVPVVAARFCRKGDCPDGPRAIIGLGLGEVEFVLAGAVLLRQAADRVALTPFATTPQADGAALVQPRVYANGTIELGATEVAAGSSVALLLRDAKGQGGAMLRLDAPADGAPTLKLSYERDRYEPNVDIGRRGGLFTSALPGPWRYRPIRAVAQRDGGRLKMVVPGIAEFMWNEGWTSASALVKAKTEGEGEGHTFATPRHELDVSRRDVGRWLDWLALLAAAIAIATVVAAWGRPPGGQGVRGVEAGALLAATTALGAFAALGAQQMGAAAVSPLAQNSTLFLSMHLSWLCIGAAAGRLVAAATHWQATDGSKPWITLGFPALSAYGQALLLLLTPVALDAAAAQLTLPAGVVAALPTQAAWALACGAAGLVAWAGAGRLLPLATATTVIAWAAAGTALLHAAAGRALLAGLSRWMEALGDASPLPWFIAPWAMGLVHAAVAARFGLRVLEWYRRADAGIRQKLLPLGATRLAAVGLVLLGTLLVVLGGGASGPLAKATLPDAVATFGTAAVALYGARASSHRAADLMKVLLLGLGLALTLLVSGLLVGDLGTMVVRSSALLLASAWAVGQLREVQTFWFIAIALSLLIAGAATRQWALVATAALLAGGATFVDFRNHRRRKQPPEHRVFRAWLLVPPALAASLLAVLVTPGLANDLRRLAARSAPLDMWLDRHLARISERDLCTSAPEAYSFCEQLLDGQRLLGTRVSAWPASVYASNLHSDLAWSHSVHLGSGVTASLVVGGLAIAFFIVSMLRTAGDGRFRFSPPFVALLGGAMAVPVASSALHVFGILGTVPLSGVPWPLLSYANTMNALVLITAAAVVAAAPRLLTTVGTSGRFRHRAIFALYLAGAACCVGGLAALSRPAPLEAVLHTSAEGILLDSGASSSVRDAPALEIAFAATSTDAASRQLDPAATACGHLVRVERPRGQHAALGVPLIAGDRIVQPLRIPAVVLPASASATDAAAVVVGFWLDDTSAGEAKYLCTDASCPLALDPHSGAALDRLAIKLATGTDPTRSKVWVRTAGRWDCSDGQGDACRVVGKQLGWEPEGVDEVAVGALTLDALAKLPPAERQQAWPFFVLRTTGGPATFVPMRVDAGERHGVALCLVGAPGLAAIDGGDGEVKLDGNGKLALGAWAIATAGLSSTRLPGCTGATCTLRFGWPSSAHSWRVAAPRWQADLAAAAWSLRTIGKDSIFDQGELRIDRSRGDDGWDDRALAAFRSDHNDGRRVVPRAMRQLLDATATQQGDRGKLLAQRIAQPSRAIATRYLPRPLPSEAWASRPSAVFDLQHFDAGRALGAPLRAFLEPAVFGVGRPAPDAGLAHGFGPSTALRPLWQASGRWAVELAAGAAQNSLPTATLASNGRSGPTSVVVSAGTPWLTVDSAMMLAGSTRTAVAALAGKVAGAAGAASFAFTGYMAHHRRVPPGPDASAAQRDGLHDRTTTAAVRDIAAELVMHANRDQSRTSLHPDLQRVVDHELLDWLIAAHVHEIEARAADAAACQGPLGAFAPADLCGKSKVVGRWRRVAALLVDYQQGQVLAASEVIGSTDVVRRERPNLTDRLPLLADGDIEVASAWKPIAAVVLNGAMGQSAWPAALRHTCTGQPAKTPPLPACTAAMGALGLRDALSRSCNHWLPLQWQQASEPARRSFDLALTRLGALEGGLGLREPLPGLVVRLDGHVRLRQELAGALPALWRDGVLRARLDVLQAQREREFWLNGMGVYASPLHLAALYATLARGALPPCAEQTADDAQCGHRWLRVDASAPSAELDGMADSAMSAGWRGPGGKALRDAVLDGMADALQSGTGVDVGLIERAARLRLVGKTGTSTPNGRDRHWHHLVSLVDPRAPFAAQRPWLLWVTVEVEPLPEDGGDFPPELRAPGAAARVWAGLAGASTRTIVNHD